MTSSLPSRAWVGALSNPCSILWCASTDRQTRTAALHGQALLAAQDPAIEAIARQLWAQTDILTETGGDLAGARFAQPPMRFGQELIAAGLLLSGPIDRDQLEHWLRVGWERSRGSLHSCDPNRRD